MGVPSPLARPIARDRPGVDDPDGALVARARGGDRAAFEELVRRHADHLYGVVRRLSLSAQEAEEVVQETFLRAWRGIGKFEGNARFFTWLYRIGINETKRHHERRAVPAFVSSLDEDGAAEPADAGQSPLDHSAQSELRAALERAVRALPLGYRAPLILRDIEGLSTAEGAALLGLGEAAFKSRLHRARLAVREAVESYLGESP